MSGLPARAALKLCDAYAELSSDAQRWTRFLEVEPSGVKFARQNALDQYERLPPTDQHGLTLFVEIAASEDVWHAEEWMETLHAHNLAHPRTDRRAWWELEAR